MANCVSAPRGDNYKDNKNVQLPPSLHQKEFQLLKMVYKDLSARIKQIQLNKENFLLFFHKNGFWGDRLFKQFDADSSNLITEDEFIKGIVRIFKTSEEQKIKLLFKFFSGGTKQTEGVAFSEFLKMLYNYPKEDLQKILNDSDFINKQVKSHLIAIDSEYKGRRFDSVCNGDIKLATAQFRYEQSDNLSDRLQSKVGRDIMRQMSRKNMLKDPTFNIKVGQNNIQVKASSIHQFVKKFAKTIFKSYTINEKTGRLQYEQFRDWLTKHKNLYDDYYQGFHSEIWQINEKDKLPEYLKKQAELTTKSRLLIGKGQDVKKVQLTLLNSVLIVTAQGRQGVPIMIICLDGLSVEKIFDTENGNGILIKHRDKYYPKKSFFFLNDKIQNTWIEKLKFFKGSSINALYDICQQIGKGKFSLVYEAKQISTNEKCAMKVINKKQLDQQSIQLIAHESSIMSVLSHPLMVSFKQTIQTNNNIYIITQLVKGKDLFELVKDLKYLQEPEAAYIFRQIIVGVRYLHSLGIVHRDLKPENVMVEYNEEIGQINKIKIIDFGFSNYLSVLVEVSSEQLMAGTPNYIAPQILVQQPFSEKIDNFAIGSMLYFALCGNPPFIGSTVGQILQKTMQGSYTVNDKHWKKISDSAKDLLSHLLQTQPDERISLDEALRHPWLKTEANTLIQTNGFGKKVKAVR